MSARRAELRRAKRLQAKAPRSPHWECVLCGHAWDATQPREAQPEHGCRIGPLETLVWVETFTSGPGPMLFDVPKKARKRGARGFAK